MVRPGRRLLAVAAVAASWHGAARGQATASAEAAPPAARATWLSRVYDESVTSLVRVECGDAVGTGFFFHSPRHVATAFHVIQSGREAVVVFADGSVSSAEVVAWDAALDIALLEVVDGGTGRPLLPSTPSGVGDEVVAIGVPMDAIVRQAHGSALPVFTLTQGAVSAVTEAAVQTDAAINPGNSGGPLLDRQGRVLGVVSRKVNDAEGLAFAVPTSRLMTLAEKVGREGPFMGVVSGGVEVGYALSEHDLDGLALGLRVVLFDRFGVAARGGWLYDERALTGGWYSETRDRTLFEAVLFYRVSFYSPPYLALHIPVGAGLALTWDDLERTTLTVRQADSGCDFATEDCGLATSATRVRLEDNRIRPLLSLELELPPLLLSSAFYFEGVELSGGRFVVGVVF